MIVYTANAVTLIYDGLHMMVYICIAAVSIHDGLHY